MSQVEEQNDSAASGAQLRLEAALRQVLELSLKLGEVQGTLARVERCLAEVRSLVGPMGVPMPGGEMLVQTLFGIKYLIDPNDIIMAPNLIIYRQWEPDISDYFWRNFTPDTVFVDVGANLGYFTCLGATRIGRASKGQVFAVEPNPSCLKLLERNLVINWSMAPVSLFRGAVGDIEGRVQLAVPHNRAANASLSIDAQRRDDTELVDVEIKRLDQILPTGLAVDFMKIDVEGHELAALKGASDVIGRSPNLRIVMEWSPSQMQEAGYPVTALIELIGQMGLRAFRLSDAGALAEGKATQLGWEAMCGMGYDNVILTH
jgi:FkbM family methyltransferase